VPLTWASARLMPWCGTGTQTPSSLIGLANELEGRIVNDPFNSTGVGPLAQVQTGMKVVDADGVDVGSVEDMSMSDPGAVTTEGEDFRPTGGIVSNVARALAGDSREPVVPEPMRTRLIRIGYIKLTGSGLLHHERYVRGDCIARVANGRVELSVRKEQLASED
jgi:hypothetical protein